MWHLRRNFRIYLCYEYHQDEKFLSRLYKFVQGLHEPWPASTRENYRKLLAFALADRRFSAGPCSMRLNCQAQLWMASFISS